jgi:hypothetical protein
MELIITAFKVGKQCWFYSDENLHSAGLFILLPFPFLIIATAA